jgi:hypothetical protein
VFGSAVHGSLREDSFRAASKAADALGRPADLVDLDDESPV